MQIKRPSTFITLVLCCLLLATPGYARQDDAPRVQVLFMHHSTGAGVIGGGDVRGLLTGLGYDFWDHGYNGEGLVDPQGNYLGTNWDVPDDNTDPDGWYAIFNQPVTDPPTNTFSHMLQADVIIFKSCFPASNIYDEEMFEQYKMYYLSIRDAMDQHPDKIFIPFTTPPLVPNETSPENAARARRWAEYLASPEYMDGHPNVFVFDFFNHLADEDGYLQADYRGDEWDSHPNDIANAALGPLLVEFIDEAVHTYIPDGTPKPGAPESSGLDIDAQPETGQDDTTEAPTEAQVTGSDVLGGFEDITTLDNWWDYMEVESGSFTYTLDSAAYAGSQALRLTIDLPAEGGASCGVDVLSGEAWSDSTGISFYVRADTPDMMMRFGLGVMEPDFGTEATTPFEYEVGPISTEWTQVTIPWDAMWIAEWHERDTGSFAPERVVWLSVDVGEWEHAIAGSIWIDELALVY